MTSIRIELSPPEIHFQTYSSLGETDAPRVERCVVLQGTPRYRATYRNASIELRRGSERLALPDLVTIRLAAGKESNPPRGQLSYLEALSDGELEISDPEQIHASFAIPRDEFDHLWRLPQFVLDMPRNNRSCTPAMPDAPGGHVVGLKMQGACLALSDVTRACWWPSSTTATGWNGVRHARAFAGGSHGSPDGKRQPNAVISVGSELKNMDATDSVAGGRRHSTRGRKGITGMPRASTLRMIGS